jgi:putative colanic acid biosynthesis acetyltransferase WcaF
MPRRQQYRSELSARNRLGRLCWSLVWALFCRLSPRPFHGWRRLWLRLFGARLDRTAAIYPSARIWAPWNLRMAARSALGDGVECYNVDLVTLDEDAVASQYAFLCTASHDISDPAKKLITAPIHLQRMSWVCAGAFVHPGVTLGEGAVAGARAVVTKDVAPWAVVAGNPAVFIKKRVLSASAGQAIAPDEASDEAPDEAPDQG